MNRTTVVLAVLAMLLVACTTAVVHAWSYDPDQNNLVCEETGPQGYPSIAHAGEGNSYIVWEDRRTGLSRVFGQLLNGEGHGVWDPCGIAMCDTASYQLGAQAFAGPDFTCYVMWMDYRTGSWRVMLQLVGPEGNFHWDPNGVSVCSDTTGQYGSSIVSDGAGGVVVAWSDVRSGMSSADVYAQRVDRWGNLLWASDGVPLCAHSGNQSVVDVAADGTGGAFVTWSDNRAGVDSLDIYIGHVTAAGFAEWTANGTRVCGSSGHQSGGGVVSDGAGGAFVVWRDERTDLDIYAQRISEYGTTLWGTNGIAVQATAADEYTPSIIDDGDAGIVVTWLDGRASPFERDIYAQRLDRFGDPLWASGGVPVCTYGDYMEAPVLLSDAAGGVIAVWEDNRPGSTTDIYSQRLDPDGNRLWDEDGVAMSTNPDTQEDCVATPDGEGGVIAAWRLGDGENDEGDIYAQRLERNGYLGFPSPAIIAVEDHPQDQGGVAVVSWVPSYLDQYPHQIVTHYSLWRKMPDVPPEERWSADPRAASVRIGLAAEAIDEFERSGWSYVDDIPASYWWTYGYDAPTYADSTAAGVPVTEYMVVAQTADQWVFWHSYTAGGYSVDNLAPGAPLALAAAAQQADVALTWSASGYHDEDLDRYIIHRNAVSGFEHGPATFIGTSTDTTYTDVNPGLGTWYYLVVGKDVHDNFGDPSNEATADTWAGVEIPERFSLRGCYPNPFNPVTTIAYDVPEPGGEVMLEIFDVRGRLVRTLVRGLETPGRKASVWDGSDETGAPLSSGVYFCRMTAEDYEKTVKVTLLK